MRMMGMTEKAKESRKKTNLRRWKTWPVRKRKMHQDASKRGRRPLPKRRRQCGRNLESWVGVLSSRKCQKKTSRRSFGIVARSEHLLPHSGSALASNFGKAFVHWSLMFWFLLKFWCQLPCVGERNAQVLVSAPLRGMHDVFMSGLSTARWQFCAKVLDSVVSCRLPCEGCNVCFVFLGVRCPCVGLWEVYAFWMNWDKHFVQWHRW